MKFCTEHGNNNAIVGAKCYNDQKNKTDVMGEWNFTRFKSRMNCRWISYKLQYSCGLHCNAFWMLLTNLNTGHYSEIYGFLGALNIKIPSCRCRNYQYEDKIVSRLSYYFDNGNSYTWEDSLYIETEPWAPSQYKDRLIYVWQFPC